MTTKNWIEIVFYVLILLGISPLVAYMLAKANLFWTLLESGNIKYIYRGDTLRRIIADVRGKKIDGYKVVDGNEPKTWWQKKIGIKWVGIWPFASIKTFMIKKKKENEDTSGKPTTQWIRDLGVEKVDSLRIAFPRPFLLEKVELGDRQTVDMLVVGKFVVVDAYIPVVELKGDFFELTSSTLRGAILDIAENHPDMDAFIAANKGEGGILEILIKPIKDPSDPTKLVPSLFNQALEKLVGLHLVGATIPDWNASDPKTREAMNAKFIAEKAREAAVVTAEAYKKRVEIETRADTARVEALGIARGHQIKATVDALATTGASKETVAQNAGRLLEAEALAGTDSKLTTLVQGGAGVVVPVGGNKP